jgi:sulfur-oxidizing protein SoxX
VRWIAAAVFLAMASCASSPHPRDAIEMPFAPTADAARGREVFASRDVGRCVLCHAAPGIDTAAGNVGPSLAGVASRLTAGQMRLRIADITRVNPETVMPTFHRVEGMVRVAPEYRGKPALDAQQVEDIVAWLETLR